MVQVVQESLLEEKTTTVAMVLRLMRKLQVRTSSSFRTDSLNAKRLSTLPLR